MTRTTRASPGAKQSRAPRSRRATTGPKSPAPTPTLPPTPYACPLGSKTVYGRIKKVSYFAAPTPPRHGTGCRVVFGAGPRQHQSGRMEEDARGRRRRPPAQRRPPRAPRGTVARRAHRGGGGGGAPTDQRGRGGCPGGRAGPLRDQLRAARRMPGRPLPSPRSPCTPPTPPPPPGRKRVWNKQGQRLSPRLPTLRVLPIYQPVDMGVRPIDLPFAARRRRTSSARAGTRTTSNGPWTSRTRSSDFTIYPPPCVPTPHLPALDCLPAACPAPTRRSASLRKRRPQTPRRAPTASTASRRAPRPLHPPPPLSHCIPERPAPPRGSRTPFF